MFSRRNDKLFLDILKLDYRNAEMTIRLKEDRVEHAFVRIFFVTFMPPVHSCLEASAVCYNTPYRIQHNVTRKAYIFFLLFNYIAFLGT